MYLDFSYEGDLMHVLQLVHDLSEQLAHNQKITATLQNQAAALRSEAASSAKDGYSLRRYNTDLSKETFESELERNNAYIVIENQSLLHENKQLSMLLKEYETTMDTIMTKFRNHALAASQHELTLTRHYEALLLTRETQSLSSDLSSSANVTESLQRLAQHLRALLLSLSGEDPDERLRQSMPSRSWNDQSGSESSGQDAVESESLIDFTELRSLLDDLEKHGYDGSQADWAEEREVEISRLEKENMELRKMLGIDEATMEENGVHLDLSKSKVGHQGPSSLQDRMGYGAGLITRGNAGSPWGGGNREDTQLREASPPEDAELGAPLQRAADLPRMAQGNGRRSGIFGAEAQGRGGRPSMPSLWSNQAPSPAPPVSWPGGTSALDLSR